MAKRGRKRRQGKRTPSGRLSRAKQPAVVYDQGTERVQALQAIYGQDGCDAIGRAYRLGFLGSGSEAKAMLDTARKISSAYRRAYETGAIRCTLGGRSGGGVVDLDHERIKREQDWIEDVLRGVGCLPNSTRRAFEQLVIDPNPDCGPRWLDELLTVELQNRDRREPIPIPAHHMATMKQAVSALSGLTK